MVVFSHAVPDKSSYRRYKIKTVEGQDDYAYMEEVLFRRFNGSAKNKMLPDLLVVDGGKGQLNIAEAVLKDLGLENELQLVGIAKKDELRGDKSDKIYKPGRSNPLNFGKDGDALLLLQRIRDEAHRFAITFHRERRSKRIISSVLDSIPGIGNKRKIALLTKFGSVRAIAKASAEELAEVEGMNLKTAGAVLEFLSDCKG
jgi:excinuclease ABC subunit C